MKLLHTVAELCADEHYNFAHFQYVSGETRTYTLSHQGRTIGRPILVAIDAELAIGQCRLGCTEPVV